MAEALQEARSQPGDPQRRAFRVLLASPVGELGGAEQVLLSLAERLGAYGIEASFAMLRPGPMQKMVEAKGFRAHTYPHDYRFRDVGAVLRCARWLADRIREDGADLLHSNVSAHLVGGLAAWLAGVPELWHIHDYASSFDLMHAISRRIPTGMAIFTTEHIRSGETRLQRGPHRVIHPDSVDSRRLAAMPADPLVRERLGIGAGPFFLTATRIQQQKGHLFLVEAAAELAEAYPEIRWVIAGRPRGPEQEQYLAELQAAVVTRGLQARVIFVGFLGEADLVPLYKEALALIHPAISEGYGLVLLEAMACGLPVIAAAAEGPAEIVTNERNGLLVPTRDSLALAAAQKRLLGDPALHERLASQALEDVQQHSFEHMVAETVACYRDVLARHSR